jgi:hypothetical protein
MVKLQQLDAKNMIKYQSKPSSKLEIDLTEPGGNAFALLNQAKHLGNKLGLDYSQIIEEMKSGDYENLVNVFDSYFGDYVILYWPTKKENKWN